MSYNKYKVREKKLNHRPSGTRNKDEPKGSFLHIKVTRKQKARWVKQAQARGMKLNAWVLEKLEPKSTKSNVWEEFVEGLKKELKNEN